MQFFTSAHVLAILALGSVVSTLPSAIVSSGLDSTVKFDDYVKQFTQPMSLNNGTESLEKRWSTTTCGGLVPLFEIASQAIDLCNSAILALEFQDDTNRRRFDRYFGAWNDYPEARGIIRDRFQLIKDTIFSQTFNLICLPNQTNGNVVADVSFYGQGQPADVRLYQAWFGLSETNLCGEQLTKANVLVHEAAHVFGAADHGDDQGNDAYLFGWYSSSVNGNCPF